jgi:Fur family zinc uptake transcriptional regulator
MLAQEGHNAAPPTVYRALDFLQQHGLVHRIASLNAFTGCNHAHERHTGMFLICQGCRNVAELTSDGVSGAVAQATAKEGFLPVETTIEVAGLCPRCQSEQASS